jgi:hypothetical protein
MRIISVILICFISLTISAKSVKLTSDFKVNILPKSSSLVELPNKENILTTISESKGSFYFIKNCNDTNNCLTKSLVIKGPHETYQLMFSNDSGIDRIPYDHFENFVTCGTNKKFTYQTLDGNFNVTVTLTSGHQSINFKEIVTKNKVVYMPHHCEDRCVDGLNICDPSSFRKICEFNKVDQPSEWACLHSMTTKQEISIEIKGNKKKFKSNHLVLTTEPVSVELFINRTEGKCGN